MRIAIMPVPGAYGCAIEACPIPGHSQRARCSSPLLLARRAHLAGGRLAHSNGTTVKDVA